MTVQQEALTADDVASLLQIKKSTVYALAKEGSLSSYRVGRKLRFSLSDVQTYIDSSRQGESDDTLSEIDKKQTDYRFGGSDVILDIMSNYLSSLGIACGRRYSNTYRALVEMYFGEVDAVTMSLWDGSSDTYNLPYIKRLLPGLPVTVLHVASYTQGLLVKKGNPKQLRKWSDILQPEVRLANREKGSSARILLDEHLMMLEADPTRIIGYSHEISSEVVQASLIANKEYDVGVGTEKVYHQVKGIDYLPLQEQQLVLVLAKRPETTKTIRLISTYLSNKALTQELSATAGYNFAHMGNCIYES